MDKRVENSYPYPPRPSELVGIKEFEESLKNAEIIDLSKEDKKELFCFETEIYRGYKYAKGIPGKTHTVYPESFADNTGSNLFSLIYLDDGLKKDMKGIAKENNFDLTDFKKNTKFWDAVFDDLEKIAEDKEKHDEYLSNGTEFSKLSEILGKNDKLVIEGSPARLIESGQKINTGEIVEIINNTSLGNLPPRIRYRVSNYSSEVAKEKLKNEMFLDKVVHNPRREHFIVNPKVYKKRLELLREFKFRLKKMKAELKEEGDDLSCAKLVVLDLYLRRLNITIVSEYELAHVLTGKKSLSREEREILEKLYIGNSFQDSSRMSRLVAKTDRFERGVGLSLTSEGEFVSIPEKLMSYMEERVGKEKPVTQEYIKYNSIILDDEQMKRFTQLIIGFSEDEQLRKWSAVVRRRKSWSARGKLKGKDVLQIVIPKGDSRGLVDVFAVAAHEFEGHAVQFANKMNLNRPLHLIRALSTGRNSIMAECGAMFVESKTMKMLVNQERSAEPYYYMALKRKSEGGNFVECLEEFMEGYSKRNYGFGLDELITDRVKFEKVFGYSHLRVLRIFRSAALLQDNMGELTNTDQLKYIEQELLGDMLSSVGLEKLMYLSGIDLYSVEDLIKINMLDLDKIKLPEYVVAKTVWPKVRKMIDEGLGMDEILNSLEAEIEEKKRKREEERKKSLGIN